MPQCVVFGLVKTVKPWGFSPPGHYRLYLQGANLADARTLHLSLASAVQTGLEENPYYRHAVQMRQLSQFEVRILDASSPPGRLIYERGCLARGQKAGNIKPTTLDVWTGWPSVFDQSAPR